MLGLAGDAERGGEVDRPDEDGVEPRHGEDLVDRLDALQSLHEDEAGCALVRLGDEARVRRVVRGADVGVRAAPALGGEACGRDGLGHRGGGGDVRHEDAVGAGVERRFDLLGPALGDPDDGENAGAPRRRDERWQELDAERSMLLVEDDGVEAASAAISTISIRGTMTKVVRRAGPSHAGRRRRLSTTAGA